MGNNNGTPITKVHLPSPLHDVHASEQYSTLLSSSEYFHRKKQYSESKTKSVGSFQDGDQRSLRNYRYSGESEDRGNLFHRFRLSKFKTSQATRRTESQDLDPNRSYTRSINSSTPLSRLNLSHEEENLSRSATDIQPSYSSNVRTCCQAKKTLSIKRIFQNNFSSHRSDISLHSFKTLSLNEDDSKVEIFNVLSTPKKRSLTSNSNAPANCKPILEKINETGSLKFFMGRRSKKKKKSTKKPVSYEDEHFFCTSQVISGNLRKSISCNTLKNPEESTEDKPSKRGQLQKCKTTSVSPQEILEKTMPHLSTSEVLRCLANFIKINCPCLFNKDQQMTSVQIKYRQENIFQPMIVASWIRGIDRSLLIQGWSEIPFISPVNITFLYMLLKDYIKESIVRTHSVLHSMIMACLYLSYSYMGNEISYPLKPFINAEMKFNQNYGPSRLDRRNERSQSASISSSSGGNTNHAFSSSFDSRQSIREHGSNHAQMDVERDRFWLKCLTIMNEKSSQMLQFNADIEFFMAHFFELCQYGTLIKEGAASPSFQSKPEKYCSNTFIKREQNSLKFQHEN